MNKIVRIFESIGNTVLFSKPEHEVTVKEVALKILLWSAEISVAVGTYYLLTDKYIVSLLPQLTDWNLKLTCLCANIVGLFILGVGIHLLGTRFQELTKNHSWKVKIFSQDLIYACSVGLLSRGIKTCFTLENPSWKSISLDTVIITLAILIGFMNLQRTGNHLFTEEEEAPLPPSKAPEKTQAPQPVLFAKELEPLKNLIENQRKSLNEEIQQRRDLESQLHKLRLEKETLQNQLAKIDENKAYIEHLETLCFEYAQKLESFEKEIKKIPDLKQENTKQSQTIQQLEKEKAGLSALNQDKQKQLDAIATKERKIQHEVNKFEPLESSQQVADLKKKNAALLLAQIENHKQIEKLQETLRKLLQEQEEGFQSAQGTPQVSPTMTSASNPTVDT